MGIRSRLRAFSKRFFVSVFCRHPKKPENLHSCRVCDVEEAIRADDNSVCAYHLLTHLDSLAPLAGVPAGPFPALAAAPLLPPPNSTKTIQQQYVPIRRTTPVYELPGSAWKCTCAESGACSCSTGYCWCTANCACECRGSRDDGTPRWGVTSTSNTPPVSSPARPDARCSSVVQPLQTALRHVRYAISGHLALQLQASRTQLSQALFDAAFVGNASITPEELVSSVAARPSIVCPRSTRDVLRSWSAVSGFDLDFDEAPRGAPFPPEPASLHMVVDGVSTSVHIDWVDDEQFNWAPYSVDDVAIGGSSSHTVPILSVASLFVHAFKAFSKSPDGTVERRILGEQVNLCRRVMQSVDMSRLRTRSPPLFRAGSRGRENIIRRKPLPPGSRHKPLPPTPETG